MTTNGDLLGRYGHALLGVFGTPALVVDRGEGCYVWDVDGKRYLDLLAGIAVNALGHNHPELVAAVSKQVGEVVQHLSPRGRTSPTTRPRHSTRAPQIPSGKLVGSVTSVRRVQLEPPQGISRY